MIRKLLVGFLVVGLLPLAGCAPRDGFHPVAPKAANGATRAPSGSAAPSSATSPAHSSASASAGSTSSLPDPRSITGPSTAQITKTIQPAATNPQQHLPVTFADATGRKVTITDASRVLTLDIYGTYTQIVESLGLTKVLVGRTSSDAQPELKHLPLVTHRGPNLNAEAVLKLRPTLVVTDTTVGPPEVLQQLQAAGVTVVTLSPARSMKTVATSIRDIATVLGVPDVGKTLNKAVEADIQSAITEIAHMAPATPMRGMALYIRGTGGLFFVMGKKRGADALIKALGGEDVASAHGINESKPANAESLVALNPEFIVVMSAGLQSTGGLAGLLKRPGMAQTVAGSKQRIIDVEGNLLLSFGPHTGAVLRGLAKAIYQP